MKHWANFPGSQAALWFGDLVDIVGPHETDVSDGVLIPVTCVPDAEECGWGYVVASTLRPIGPVARELLKGRR